jgi:DNA-binding response OmpR family regulator
MRVLLVEDQKHIAEEIKIFLEKEGYICDWAADFETASENIAVNPYDFVLLDLGLPDGNGLELIDEVKEYQKDASIIILTARTEVDDRITGLQLGADDYIPKPFSLLELKARMHAILRRKSGWQKDILKIGDFGFDLQNKIVSFDSEQIDLTQKELKLLFFLLINKNRIINRFQLSEHLWGDHLDDHYQSNYIDVHISNLRKKLGIFAQVDWLETVRGLGYRIKI